MSRAVFNALIGNIVTVVLACLLVLPPLLCAMKIVRRSEVKAITRFSDRNPLMRYVYGPCAAGCCCLWGVYCFIALSVSNILFLIVFPLSIIAIMSFASLLIAPFLVLNCALSALLTWMKLRSPFLIILVLLTVPIISFLVPVFCLFLSPHIFFHIFSHIFSGQTWREQDILLLSSVMPPTLFWGWAVWQKLCLRRLYDGFMQRGER